MKVCVYAIAKNEEKFARRWLDSMSEADGVYVLDTGSSDETVRLLKEGGAIVEQRIFEPTRATPRSPWCPTTRTSASART